MITNNVTRCTRTVLRSGGPRRALSLAPAPTHRRPRCTEPPSLFVLEMPPRPAARAPQEEDWVCAVAEALPDGNLISWRFAHELSLKAEQPLPSPRRTAENLDKLQSLLGLDRPAALRVARRKPALLAKHPQTLRSNLRSIQTSSRVCESTARLMAETRPGLLLDKVGWTSLTEPSSH